MKKYVSLFLALVLLTLSLASCSLGKNVGCGELMEEITSLFPDLPGSDSVYLSGGDGEQLLGEQDASYLYTGEYAALPEWELVSDYAVRLPDRPQIYEVHILKVKDETMAESVSKILCHRADLLAKYFVTPEKTGEFDYSSYRADVYVKDSYVFLLATPDNDQVIALIEKKL